MRTTIGVVTFCVVAAGAVGVSAELDLLTSDALQDLTVELLSTDALDCGGLNQGGSLGYVGSDGLMGWGSDTAEAAMRSNSQQVAPMSRRMYTYVCTGTSTSNPSRAEGIVFALDGVSVVGNRDTVHSCAGSLQQASDGSQCGVDNPPAGLRFTGSLACGLTLTSWKDVLRLVYFGFRPGVTTPAPTDQNCSDPCRTELLNNYAELFQGACTLGAGCTQLWHAFRLNDASDANAIFISAIRGVPPTDVANNYSPFCNSATIGPSVSMVGVSCSVAATANDGICSRDGTNNTVGTCDTVNGKCGSVSCDADSDCTPCNGAAPDGICNQSTHKCTMVDVTAPQTLLPNHRDTVLTGTNTVSTLNYYAIGVTPPNTPIAGTPVDMQDGDPIRRICLFQNHHDADTVCGLDNTLGVVLPIWDATVVSQNIGPSNAFPTTACGQGTFGCAPAVRISFANHVNTFALCPDGTDPNVKPNGTSCAIDECYTPQAGPVSAPEWFCINSSGNTGATHTKDGRVYNLTVWNLNNNQIGLYPRPTGQCAASTANMTNLTPMYRGAFFRLHQNFVETNATAGTQPCKAGSATDQISCLVQASPCSIGVARNSEAVSGNTVAMNVNNVAPSTPCIQNLLLHPLSGPPTYPFAEKLYLNTIAGFESLPAGGPDQQNEFKLAKCFAGQSGRTAGSAVDIAASWGFTPLPTNTVPFCDDVANDLCGTGSSCANNPPGIPISGYPNPSPGNSQN
jgi:hypothetical protein